MMRNTGSWLHLLGDGQLALIDTKELDQLLCDLGDELKGTQIKKLVLN